MADAVERAPHSAVVAWPVFPPGSRREPVPQQHPPVLCLSPPVAARSGIAGTTEGTGSSCRRYKRNTRALFHGPLAQSGVREAVDVADDHVVRRADHEPRAAAHGRGAAARDAVADGRAGRARDAAVRAREPARRRADRSRAQAADRHRRRHRARRSRCSRFPSPRTSARCRSRSCSSSASSAACRTSSAAPPTRCCSRRSPGRGGWSRRTPRSTLGETSSALIGPGLAGGLIQLLTAPFAIVLDALHVLRLGADAAADPRAARRAASGAERRR